LVSKKRRLGAAFFVIARSAATKQSSLRQELDCFASLAMTSGASATCLLSSCHPAIAVPPVAPDISVIEDGDIA
jgi:hypothetical protein